MKKVLITQSNYIPWKGFFDAINMADVLVLYDDMQFTKRDWRNRNRIKTAQGVKWLTIPVEVKGKFDQKINETKVGDIYWAREHWQTIRHTYGKAPFFSMHKDLIESLYLDCSEELLSQINYRFLKGLCRLLDIKTEIRWSSEFELRGDKTEKLVNLCLDIGAKSYLTGPAAKDYLNVESFVKNNIQVEWLDFSGYPVYPQLHGDFNHHVTIIDLIFNTGPSIKNFMKSFGYVINN